MPALSSADHSVNPPAVAIPREFNAAYDLIERNLRAGRAAKIAYIDDCGSYTYGELAERVARCSSALTALGVRMEQRVLICMQDTIDWPTAFLGCIQAGIVPVAVNTLLTSADYEFMLRDSRAQALIVSASLLPTFAPIVGGVPALKHVIVAGTERGPHLHFSELLAQAEARFEVAHTLADDMCFWLYSSGSTGTPKGTVHVHSSLIQTAELYGRGVLGIREDDVVFSAAKLFFAYGLGNALSFPMSVGATSVLMAERPTPDAVFARLTQLQPTIFYARVCPSATKSGYALACRPEKHSLGKSANAGGITSASTFSTASVRRKCSISFLPIGPVTFAMARPAGPCPAIS
jgi:benzoate-CoA ligase